MDQPQIHMRRHNSLPANRSTSTLFLRNVSSRFNPHVGTFRHAPPAATTSRNVKWKIASPTVPASSCVRTSMLSLTDKKCPYIGSFRHAPDYTTSKSWFEKALCEWLLSSVQHEKAFCLTDVLMISGHLRGGSPYWRRSDEIQSNNHQLGAKHAVSSALVKIACWVLFGEQPKSRGRNKSHGDVFRQESVSDDSSVSTDHSGSDDNSCCSTSSSVSTRFNSMPQDGSSSLSDLALLSSQAEAYYAHAMVNKETTTAEATDDDFIENLDYTVSITQIDVMRMMRNASRHLDVQSIVQLPIITYQPTEQEAVEDAEDAHSKQASSTGSFTSVDDSTTTPEEMSWLLIQRDDEHGVQVAQSATSSATSKSKLTSLKPRDGDIDHICVICLEHFVAGDRLRLLPCHHSFHVGCIDRWLSGSCSFDDCITSGCPTCKKRPDVNDIDMDVMDGSVPSWAFARIGTALAASQMK